MTRRMLSLVILGILVVVVSVFVLNRYRVQRVSYRMDPDRRALRVGVDIFPGFAPVHLGVVSGIFDRHGLRVTPIVLRSTSERRAALFRGDVDAICATINELAIAWTQGARAVIVSGIDESAGGDGIVAKQEIRSVLDLRGKRIALETGSPSHFFLIYLLAKHKLTLEDVQVVSMEASQVAPSFLGGGVDAGVTWDPWLHSIALNPASKSHILTSTKDHPGVILDVLAFRPEFVARNPDSVLRLIEGWFDVLDYMEKNPVESTGIMADWMRIQPEELRGMLSGIRLSDLEHSKTLFGTGNQPGSLSGLIRDTSDLWLKSQNIKFAIKPEQIIDASFIRKIAERQVE